MWDGSNRSRTPQRDKNMLRERWGMGGHRWAHAARTPCGNTGTAVAKVVKVVVFPKQFRCTEPFVVGLAVRGGPKPSAFQSFLTLCCKSLPKGRGPPPHSRYSYVHPCCHRTCWRQRISGVFALSALLEASQRIPPHQLSVFSRSRADAPCSALKRAELSGAMAEWASIEALCFAASSSLSPRP